MVAAAANPARSNVSRPNTDLKAIELQFRRPPCAAEGGKVGGDGARVVVGRVWLLRTPPKPPFGGRMRGQSNLTFRLAVTGLTVLRHCRSGRRWRGTLSAKLVRCSPLPLQLACVSSFRGTRNSVMAPCPFQASRSSGDCMTGLTEINEARKCRRRNRARCLPAAYPETARQ
jgi:hypothetical protein